VQDSKGEVYHLTGSAVIVRWLLSGRRNSNMVTFFVTRDHLRDDVDALLCGMLEPPSEK
jgi:hypothetical protein